MKIKHLWRYGLRLFPLRNFEKPENLEFVVGESYNSWRERETLNCLGCLILACLICVWDFAYLLYTQELFHGTFSISWINTETCLSLDLKLFHFEKLILNKFRRSPRRTSWTSCSCASASCSTRRVIFDLWTLNDVSWSWLVGHCNNESVKRVSFGVQSYYMRCL